MGKETQKHSSQTCKSKELLKVPAYQVGKPMGLHGDVEFRLYLESARLGIPGCLFAGKQTGYKCQEFPFAWITHRECHQAGSSSFLADVSHHLQTGDDVTAGEKGNTALPNTLITLSQQQDVKTHFLVAV